MPGQGRCGAGSSGGGLASALDKGPLCCPRLRGNLLGRDIFLLPPLHALSLLRNSCDQDRGRARRHRLLRGAWGAGSPFPKPLSPLAPGGSGTPPVLFWGAVPPLTLLFVAQVEDGGKAALSRRLQPGDELVNISGTPLYGSRQEALILIKGSYRTLKMIVRRLAALRVGGAEGVVVPRVGGLHLLRGLAGAWWCPCLHPSLEVPCAGMGWGQPHHGCQHPMVSGGSPTQCATSAAGAVWRARHPLAGRYPQVWPLLSLPACLRAAGLGKEGEAGLGSAVVSTTSPPPNLHPLPGCILTGLQQHPGAEAAQGTGCHGAVLGLSSIHGEFEGSGGEGPLC